MVSVLLSLIKMPFAAAFIGNGPSNHSILISPGNCLSSHLKWQCILIESLMDGNCTEVIVSSAKQKLTVKKLQQFMGTLATHVGLHISVAIQKTLN